MFNICLSKSVRLCRTSLGSCFFSSMHKRSAHVREVVAKKWLKLFCSFLQRQVGTSPRRLQCVKSSFSETQRGQRALQAGGATTPTDTANFLFYHWHCKNQTPGVCVKFPFIADNKSSIIMDLNVKVVNKVRDRNIFNKKSSELRDEATASSFLLRFDFQRRSKLFLFFLITQRRALVHLLPLDWIAVIYCVGIKRPLI